MPHQLNQLLIDGLLANWRPRYAQSTLYTRTGILRRLLHTLTTFGAPTIRLPRTKPGKPRPRVATDAEVQALLHHAPAHFRLFILLCWQTALRHAEALRVTPRSYNRENQTVTIRVKGGTERTVPVTPQIAALLQSACDAATDENQSCVFALRGRTLAGASMYSAWARLCRQAGISGLNPHDLRRTTLTQLYRVTHDLRAVQQFAGHESLTSTLHYLAPLQEEQLREYQKLLAFHSEVKQ
jgi:integrase